MMSNSNEFHKLTSTTYKRKNLILSLEVKFYLRILTGFYTFALSYLCSLHYQFLSGIVNQSILLNIHCHYSLKVSMVDLTTLVCTKQMKQSTLHFPLQNLLPIKLNYLFNRVSSLSCAATPRCSIQKSIFQDFTNVATSLLLPIIDRRS